MNTTIKFFIAFAWLLVSAFAQELAPLAQSHRTASETLAGQHAAELARLRQPYLSALAAADLAATKAGNAPALRAIEQEREAVNGGKLRMEIPQALPRTLSPSRRALISAELRAAADADKRQKAVTSDYLQKLGVLQLKAARDPALAAQIADEKSRVLSGISGAITDLKSGLSGTKWRLFKGEGYDELSFGEDGKVNGNWKYEVTARDKVKVIWDKSSAMTLTLEKNGSSLSAGDKTWSLERN